MFYLICFSCHAQSFSLFSIVKRSVLALPMPLSSSLSRLRLILNTTLDYLPLSWKEQLWTGSRRTILPAHLPPTEHVRAFSNLTEYSPRKMVPSHLNHWLSPRHCFADLCSGNFTRFHCLIVVIELLVVYYLAFRPNNNKRIIFILCTNHYSAISGP